MSADAPTEDQARAVRYAGFNVRSAAYTIDGVIVIALTYALYYLMGGDAQAQGMEELARQLSDASQNPDMTAATADLLDSMLGGGPSFWLATFVSSAYNIGFGVSRWHGTPGKHWRGTKIVMADGSPLTLTASVVRHLATGLSTILLFVGFMMAGWTRQKTALHDLIAGTRVIYREGFGS